MNYVGQGCYTISKRAYRKRKVKLLISTRHMYMIISPVPFFISRMNT